MRGLVGIVAVTVLVGLSVAAWFAGGTVSAEGALPDRTGLPGAGAWPTWRGPKSNGHADADQHPPRTWSATENIVWKSPIPGRGHGSPIVVNGKVIVSTADEKAQVQSVLCFDAATGKELWKTDIHRGNFTFKNEKASLASSTAAFDGERLFVPFHNAGAVHLTALDLAGKQLWQTKVCDYVVHQGFVASPLVHGPLVLISADNKGGGAVAGLDRKSGKIVWSQDRPKKPNYTSPIVVRADGKEQLIYTGCDLITSYDPASGKKLWEVDGATTECVTSTVTDGTLVFTSGGYPENHVSAVRADGSGKIEWRNNTRVYVPSMIVKGEHLYAVTDAGVAVCWKCDTGKEAWRGRLGGTFSSSPVLVGDVIYVTNESGKTFLFEAKPSAFKKLGENQLGDEVFSSPAICGGKIYMRVAEKREGKREEAIYCLGEK